MAYKTEELKVKALEVAKKYNCIFIEEVATAMGISKQTYYDHKLDELDELKILIEGNKFKIKNGLRAKWYENNNATTEIALYKLTATKEELHQLSTNRNENTNINANIETKEMTQEEIAEKLKRLNEIVNG